MKILYWICLALMIIGGINLGFVGVFNYDLVANLLGSLSFYAKYLYAAVGIAAIVMFLIQIGKTNLNLVETNNQNANENENQKLAY